MKQQSVKLPKIFLDFPPPPKYNMLMLTKIQPEEFDIANAYLKYGTSDEVSRQLGVPTHKVVEILQQPQVKTYIDGIYLDQGYRNRDKLGALLDKIIDKKLEEAEESEVYTNKDLVDLITLAHKMRMEEIKASKKEQSTTVNVANFGEGSNYGKLMEKLTS